MRSRSASLRANRASRATCSTSCREITLELLQLRVLQREPLAPDAGEAHGHDGVGAVALDADLQALAEAGVAHAGADPDWPRLLLGLVARHLAGGQGGRLLHAAAVERQEAILRHLAQEPGRLAHPVAVDAPVERPRQREPLLGARDPDVAQAALLLDLVGVVHRARVREDALLEPGEEHRRELQ